MNGHYPYFEAFVEISFEMSFFIFVFKLLWYNWVKYEYVQFYISEVLFKNKEKGNELN